MSGVGLVGQVVNSKMVNNTQSSVQMNKNNENSQKITPPSAGNMGSDNVKNSMSQTIVGKAMTTIKCFDDDSKCMPPQKPFISSFRDPIAVIDKIRNSEGIGQDKALINFKDSLNKMGTGELRMMRDHLVDCMADPKNDDDQLLGALLQTVNNEIDSRGASMPKPLQPWDIELPKKDPWGNGGCFPNPLNKKDFIKELHEVK